MFDVKDISSKEEFNKWFDNIRSVLTSTSHYNKGHLHLDMAFLFLHDNL
jgi:hypothetical protein